MGAEKRRGEAGCRTQCDCKGEVVPPIHHSSPRRTHIPNPIAPFSSPLTCNMLAARKVAVAGKATRPAVASRTRGVKAMAFKVTLKTPGGEGSRAICPPSAWRRQASPGPGSAANGWAPIQLAICSAAWTPRRPRFAPPQARR